MGGTSRDLRPQSSECPMTGAVTTHVLDTTTGTPAAGIAVVLERRSAPGLWEEVGRCATDAGGRTSSLLGSGQALTLGTYRLTLETRGYFGAVGVSCLYPEIVVVFEVEHTDEHFHLPVLLSPFAFSTYRGS